MNDSPEFERDLRKLVDDYYKGSKPKLKKLKPPTHCQVCGNPLADGRCCFINHKQD